MRDHQHVRTTLWAGCVLAWAGAVVVVVALTVSSGSADTTKPPVGAAPVARPPHGAVVAPASWEGSYPLAHEGGGGLCPSGTGTLVVSSGKFSLPYNIGKLNVGRIEGTVQPDGTATASAVFAQPFPTELRRMMKRYYDKPLAAVPIPLADIHDVSVAFSRLEGKPQAAITITSKKWSDFFACKLAWGVQPLTTYSHTGSLIGVKDGIITLQEGSEKRVYALDKDTKVSGELKTESRVTLVDKLSAVSVDPKASDKPQASIAGPAIDYVTGTVLGVSDDVITLWNSDKWEFERGNDTKGAGELKAGTKVTIFYRITAVSVEAKPPPTADERRAAAAEQREQEKQDKQSRGRSDCDDRCTDTARTTWSRCGEDKTACDDRCRQADTACCNALTSGDCASSHCWSEQVDCDNGCDQTEKTCSSRASHDEFECQVDCRQQFQ
jgi:hypothetical protein